MNIFAFVLFLFFSEVNVEFIAGNFEYPIHMSWFDDEILIVEQRGTVKKIDNEKPGEIWLDIREKITSGGEKGLLSIAIGPKNTPSENWVFVNYTAKEDGRTVVSGFPIDPKTNKPIVSKEIVLMEIPQPWANHNGGYIVFGPDNYLYIGMGDGGAGGDPRKHGQNKSTYLGSMLRIEPTPRQEQKYKIPEKNPFYNTDKPNKEILHWGLRNPWRFSFDKITNELWIADVGQNKWEEIHKSSFEKTSINFGWNIMEGKECYDPPKNCLKKGLDIPFYVYSHKEGVSITGGYVYRGKKIENLKEKYIFADYASGSAYTINIKNENQKMEKLTMMWNGDEFEGSITSFAEDKEGELYLITHWGTIVKLAP